MEYGGSYDSRAVVNLALVLIFSFFFAFGVSEAGADCVLVGGKLAGAGVAVGRPIVGVL